MKRNLIYFIGTNNMYVSLKGKNLSNNSTNKNALQYILMNSKNVYCAITMKTNDVMNIPKKYFISIENVREWEKVILSINQLVGLENNVFGLLT